MSNRVFTDTRVGEVLIMRKFSKKFFSITLAVAMTFSIIPGTDFSGLIKNVSAAESMVDDNIQITTNIIPDVQLCYAVRYIIGGDKYANITVKDLRTYTGKIDLSTYPDYDKIESLEGLGYARKASAIDASRLSKVKRIEANEFQNCGFKQFGMPSNIVEIGKEAFFNCANLETVDLPQTLVTIQSEAFRNCKALDGIVLPEKIAKIGNNAFAICENLKSIVIPDGINAAIENAGDDSVVGIGGGVFDGCIRLDSVKLGAGMTAIPAGFLSNTTSLKSIEIPEKIVKIMDSAFSGSGLLKIDLSANTGITAIETSVFEMCEELYDVKLPDSIERIEEGAFNGCYSIYDFSFVTKLTKLKTIGRASFSHCNFFSVEIPGTVESIGAYAFSQNDLMEELVIDDFPDVKGDVVKKIGNYAFSDSTSLKKVKLPTDNEYNQRVTLEIGDYAFSGCSRMENINFPANLIKIGDYAFNECGYSVTDWAKDDDEFIGTDKAIKYFIMPDDIHASKEDGDEKVIVYSSQNANYYQPKEAYINPDKLKKSANEAGDDSIEIYIQISENSPDYAYASNLHYQYIVGLTNVDLSKCSKLTLGKYAFYKCLNLKRVSLPKELKVIPEYAFAECSTKILMGNGLAVSSLGVKAIDDEWYTGLETVEMGDNIEKIGRFAFYNDFNLVIDGELPQALKVIENGAYQGCESLKSVVLPRNLETIGDNAFADSSRIAENYMTDKKELNLDASYAGKLQYIGLGAFSNSGLRSFVMDKNAPLTIINRSAFYGCQYLDTVVLSKAVACVDNQALGACIRLKSVNVYDKCTFKTDSIMGGIDNEKFPKTGWSGIGYNNNGKFYLTTYNFNLAITPLNEQITVRLNEETIIPLYTIASDSNGYYSQVKVADNSYLYDAKIGNLDGEKNPERTKMVPTQKIAVNKADKNDYTDAYQNSAYAVVLKGLSEGEKIGVNIQEYLQLRVADGVVSVYSPTVSYVADVTRVPCVDIVTDDKQYISVDEKAGVKISPKFVSKTGDPITDTVEWDVLTGADYISMTVADDGLSVTISPKGGSCGTASIRVKAGQVTKVIYINVVSPANLITISPRGSIDMMYGTTTDIEASEILLGDDENAEYRDTIKFTSSNENIVKVTKTTEVDGKFVCTLQAVGAGEATINAKAMAGRGQASLKVCVSSKNLRIKLYDGEGNELKIENNGKVYITDEISYIYGFNEELLSNDIVVKSSNEDVVKTNVNTFADKISFRPLKVGKSQITIYPAVGNEENGVTFTMHVNGNITDIRLSSKSIQEGATDSVFSYMTNNFRDRITEATEENYKKITNNKIEFVSGNPDKAVVDSYGNVTVKKYSENERTVTITCNVYNDDGKIIKSESTTITIEKPKVTGVKITGNTSTKVGQTVKLGIEILPHTGDYNDIIVDLVEGNYVTAKWELSQDQKTLSVTGINAGTVALEIRANKNRIMQASKTVKIVVSKPSVSVKTPGKVKWAKCKGGKKKISLKWKKVSGATGYQIQISKKKKGGYKTVKKINSGKSLGCTIKKLKKKKKYYFRIRAFVKKSGVTKYGKWSGIKAVKTK